MTENYFTKKAWNQKKFKTYLKTIIVIILKTKNDKSH